MHDWPLNDEHVWSKWQAATQMEQYRVCIHPGCPEVEYREVPSGRPGGGNAAAQLNAAGNQQNTQSSELNPREDSEVDRP